MNNLERFQKFMKYNMQIKKIMTECSPDQNTYISTSDNENAIKYSNKLFNEMRNIESIFLNIMEALPGYKKLYDEYFRNIFYEAYQAININSGNLENLKKVYRQYFSDIRTEIINEVGQNCKGYYIGFVNFKHAKSINELLHMMHQSIINNEQFYKEMPQIATKTGAYGPVTLYGNKSTIGEQIFNCFNSEILSEASDILSISDDSVIMMIRNYGHALTVEVERENEFYYVRYFIPKICHVGMINQLPGVRKVDDNSKFTTGVFQTNPENVAVDLVEFIKMVPQDKHMDIESEQFYRETQTTI